MPVGTHPRRGLSRDKMSFEWETKMSKVTVDVSTCVGCGLCEQSCPEIFEVGGDGIAHVKVNSCALHNIQEVFELCPVNSIKL